MNKLNISTAAVLGALLAACGGGSDTPAPAAAPGATPPAVTPPIVVPPVITPPVLTPPVVIPPVLTPPVLSSAQGFWDNAGDNNAGATRSSAVILPNGQGWIVFETGGAVSALATVSLKVDGSAYGGSGQYYTLPGGAAQELRLGASLPAGARTSLQTTAAIGQAAPVGASWTYNTSYDSAISQRDVQARWSGTAGAISLSWEVDAAGKLSGTSSTGCTYSGTLAVNASAPAVLDVALEEACAGARQSLQGIARLNADKTSLSAVYTSAGGARGGAFILKK